VSAAPDTAYYSPLIRYPAMSNAIRPTEDGQKFLDFSGSSSIGRPHRVRAVKLRSSVPLRLTAGKLEIREHEVGFRCIVDDKLIDCTISCQALLDLAGVYGLSHEASALEAFGELVLPIEKIASRKYEAGRFEENGELKIGTADLLRYGFQTQDI
jgi:hypothetical protein